MHEAGIYRITDLVEKPDPEIAPSCLAVMGRYVLSPSIFDLLKNSQKGAGGEIQLTDAIRSLSVSEPVWGIMYRGERFDCGTNESWLRATIAMAVRRDDLREIVFEEVRRRGPEGGVCSLNNK